MRHVGSGWLGANLPHEILSILSQTNCFHFPLSPVPQCGLFTKTYHLLLRHDRVCNAHSLTSGNSKAIRIKWDVKTKWRKYLVFTKVPISFTSIARKIMICRHNHRISGWQDMTMWPTYSAAHLSPVSHTRCTHFTKQPEEDRAEYFGTTQSTYPPYVVTITAGYCNGSAGVGKWHGWGDHSCSNIYLLTIYIYIHIRNTVT